jgi:alpha-D-ribose 1-methylphosphonate 5-triphosphate synthase subunit PhnG
MRRGVVKLAGVWLVEGVSGGGGVVSVLGQAAVGRAVVPVIRSQIAKRMSISVR